MNTRPQIFIGSSQEAFDKGIPNKLVLMMKDWCDVQTWPSQFALSQTIIESLEDEFPKYDAFVFILTPDVIIFDRENQYSSARDNLLFEMGLAMGLKKRKNIFIIKQKCNNKAEEIKLPSDILGVNCGEFSLIEKDENKKPEENKTGKIKKDDAKKTDENKTCILNDIEFEKLSNKIMMEYMKSHTDSPIVIANEIFMGKVKDLSESIGEPIKEIKKTIGDIGKALENDIAVLSGAQKSGIVNIFPNRYETIAGGSLNDCIIKEFESTKSHICIMGISLGDYFLDRGVMHKHFMNLIQRQAAKKDGECNDDGIHIRALIVDPNCRALIERAFWEAGPEYCQDAKAYVDSTTYIETDGAARIARRLENNFSSLEVKTYTQAPTCFLLLTERYAFVENYTYASRGSSCPNLQITEGKPLYDLYKKHFDNVWKKATSVKEYVKMDTLDKEFEYFKNRIGANNKTK
jgi:hypothetical protein